MLSSYRLGVYCICGWKGLDDVNDTDFNNHIIGDMDTIHRMCSYGEHILCQEVSEKNKIINNLELQLESNCSEEVILLRERVLLLTKEVENLKQKLYANTNNEQSTNIEHTVSRGHSVSSSASDSRSRLSKRRSS